MKKSLLWALILPMFLVLLSACEKDDDSDDSFKITIPDISSLTFRKISEVRAVAWPSRSVLASCNVNNGSVELNLPRIIPTMSLISINDYFNTDFDLDVYEVSDPKAEFAMVYFIGYASDGTSTGTFVRMNWSDNEQLRQYHYYWYADTPVTVKGGFTTDDEDYSFEISIDVTLAKGWNRIVENEYSNGSAIYKREYLNDFSDYEKWTYAL